MRAFAIDLYLWVEDLEDWQLLPARGAAPRWPFPPGITRDSILSGIGGLTFRVDDVLWLGNERDGLSLDMIVSALEESQRRVALGSSLTRLPVGEHLSLEVNQADDGEHVLISRVCTRVPNDYLERTAVATGAYFRDFAVDGSLWRQAVDRTLDGLAMIFAESASSGMEAHSSVLAKWLLQRHAGLS
jgi:hypothetical protein